MTERLKEGEDYVVDESGLMVFTAAYLMKRGYCCGNGCRNCPYNRERSAAGAPKKGAAPGAKLFLVTGASDGIGRATAHGLARLGHALALHGRDRPKLEATAAQVTELGFPAPRLFTADFADLAQVRELAREVAAAFPRLDGIVHNAGLMLSGSERRTSAQGFELTLAVNQLAPFLLNELLVPRLAAGGRIVIVSSALHRRADPKLDLFDPAAPSDGSRAYSASKLYNVLWANELARRLEPRGIAVNSLHPGVINTSLLRGLGGPLGLAAGVAKNLFFSTPEKGARTSVYLATSPEATGTGGYYEDRRPREPAPIALDRTLQARIWQESEKAVRGFL